MAQYYYKTLDKNGTLASVMVLSNPTSIPSCIPLTKEEFETLSVMVQASPPPPYDWKAEYRAAKSESERIAVITQRLGLI